MKVIIVVQTTDGNHQYLADIQTGDYRQVMNEVRKGRHVIGASSIATVHLENDKTAFRVGNEKDTGAWLKKRFETWKPQNVQQFAETIAEAKKNG
jgi:hypothetical protein